MQSNDIQRLIAHVVCLNVIRSLTSALQLWDKKGLAVWHKCQLLLNQREEKLAMRLVAGPKPNQLPEIIGSYFTKKKEELAVRPVSPWDLPLRGGCTLTHTVPSIQKMPQDLFPQPTTVASDLTYSILGHCCLASQGPDPTCILTFNAF